MTATPDDGQGMPAVPQTVQIRSLVGVYDAVGTLRGKLAYVAAKLTGRAHCALCDITHRGVRHSRAFDEACQSLPVDIELVHLQSRSEEVLAASDGRAPCVLARTDSAVVMLLGPDDLAACDGSPDALVAAIRVAAVERTLAWPASS
ncbi:MAG: hypothetical protein ACRD0U_14460 [Acidimicrobiales bacterium]